MTDLQEENEKHVKKEVAVPGQLVGTDFVVLGIGNDTMIAKMLYKPTDFVPFHKRPNEQGGYVISGKCKVKFGREEFILTEEDTYSIPAGVEHFIEIIEAAK